MSNTKPWMPKTPYEVRSLAIVRKFYQDMKRRGHSRGQVIDMLDLVDSQSASNTTTPR